MTPGSIHDRLELVWFNASPTGPIADTNLGLLGQQVVRIQAGQLKTIARSSSAARTTVVNDLSNHIYFPFAKVISRDHADIIWLNGHPYVRDRHSTHGTYIARRKASVSADGQVVESDPHAPFHRLEVLTALHHGDLIEFGKQCSRGDTQYQPVRCYVRLVPATASAGSSPRPAAPSTPHKPFSLVNDVLDSESDIASIDANGFSSDNLQSNLSTAPTILGSSQPDVVDLTSDDEGAPESVSSVSESESGSEDSESETGCESDTSALGEQSQSDLDFLNEGLEGSCDRCESTSIAWRREAHEAAHEQAELACEAIEARNQGDNYMAEYKYMWHDRPESPAPSIASSPALEKRKHDPSPKIRSSEDKVVSNEAAPAKLDQTALTEAAAQNEEEKQVSDLSDTFVQQPVNPPSIDSSSGDIDSVATVDQTSCSKRKMEDDTDGERAEYASETSPDSSSEASYSSYSEASTACTSASGSPPPSKKRRTLRHIPRSNPAPTPSRGRLMKKLVLKTMYATSLLSIGFLGGSLFTFKSMLNAAAAANAAGSGR